MLNFFRSLFGGSADDGDISMSSAVQLFMGNTVPRTAALLGYGGNPEMTDGHRFIEAEIRIYIRSLEDEIASLRQENAQLQAALQEGN